MSDLSAEEAGQMIDLDAAIGVVARVKTGLYGGKGVPTLDLTALVAHAEIALSEIADLRSQLAESQLEGRAIQAKLDEADEACRFLMEERIKSQRENASVCEEAADTMRYLVPADVGLDEWPEDCEDLPERLAKILAPVRPA